MNVYPLLTKVYENNSDWTLGQNKPNSKPISEKPKMNANAFSQKDYENETAFRPKKTNPNKPNFKRGKTVQRMPSGKKEFGRLSSVFCLLSSVLLTGQSGFINMVSDKIIDNSAEVTGAWWCPWSSKPVWG